MIKYHLYFHNVQKCFSCIISINYQTLFIYFTSTPWCGARPLLQGETLSRRAEQRTAPPSTLARTVIWSRVVGEHSGRYRVTQNISRKISWTHNVTQWMFNAQKKHIYLSFHMHIVYNFKVAYCHRYSRCRKYYYRFSCVVLNIWLESVLHSILELWMSRNQGQRLCSHSLNFD